MAQTRIAHKIGGFGDIHFTGGQKLAGLFKAHLPKASENRVAEKGFEALIQFAMVHARDFCQIIQTWRVGKVF